MSLPRCRCGFVMPGPMHGVDCKHYDPESIYRESVPADPEPEPEADDPMGLLVKLKKAGQLIDEATQKLEKTHGMMLNSLAGHTMEAIQREAVIQTLEFTDGNRKEAAQLLGVGERSVYRWIEKYGLERVRRPR